MFKSNYHTHTKYCNHAEGEIEDYIKLAIDNGFEELGFTDHMPTKDELLIDEKYKTLIYLGELFQDRMDFKDVNKYLNDINRLKDKYKDKIKIYVGFECEYSEKTKDIVNYLHQLSDYLILGMHHFYVGDKLYNTYSSRDMNIDSVVLYAKECEKALDMGLFKIIAHPDLFMFNFLKNDGRLFTKECEEATRIIVEAAIRNNVYLELNVHEIKFSKKNGINPWRYPRDEFWEIVSKYKDAKVIVGMDAHSPMQLIDSNVDSILELANKYDIKIEDRIILAKE